MTQLSATTLQNAQAEKPNYYRNDLTPGIVHLGVGAFHRAHQAVYTDAVLSENTGWGIVGASLRSRAVADRLNAQDGLYSVLIKDGDQIRVQVIGSLLEVIPASDDPEALLTAMIAPEVRIVSLTITEKGYCHVPATGRLDLSNPAIANDLATPRSPKTAIGFIVEALRQRLEAGVPPFTVMSCDNLPDNGSVARAVVTDFAAQIDQGLADAIAKQVKFPATMVDRITPATTEVDVAKANAVIGLRDDMPVVCEAFSQWVVEDDFCDNQRPPWEDAGVLLVKDVAPFEHMKLRMLNGTHSMLAYIGCLGGLATISATIANADLRQLVHDVMTDEIIPTLTPPQGMDLQSYRDALISRYENTGLEHHTRQIAMDGSQKIPQRILGTIQDRIAAGQPYDRLAFAVAAWMEFVSQTGTDLDDPMADVLSTAAKTPSEALVAQLLALDQVFSDDLAANESFRKLLTSNVKAIREDGVMNTIQARNSGAASW